MQVTLLRWLPGQVRTELTVAKAQSLLLGSQSSS